MSATLRHFSGRSYAPVWLVATVVTILASECGYIAGVLA